jgi:ubiquinone biosynthesis protein UbiJ
VIENLVLGALNHLLGQAEWARRQLQAFAGRQARFDMPPWQLAFSVSAEGLFEPVGEGEIDVTVALPAETPLLALQGIDRAMAEAHVTGNAEFATALSFVLKNLRWDAEEDLAKVVGDIAAHRIFGAASSLADWQRQTIRNVAENIGEYLAEESRLLVSRREFNAFSDELADLVTRIDALAARAGKPGRLA